MGCIRREATQCSYFANNPANVVTKGIEQKVYSDP